MGRRGALAAALAALGLSLMAFCLAAGEGRMPGGTFVAGVPVEGLTRAEALTALEGAAEAYGETEILFYCGDQLAAAVKSREIGAAPDLEAAVDLALVEGGDIWPRVRIDRSALEELLPPAPKNARYDRERGQVAPSVVTLLDLIECLGTTAADFFREAEEEQVVFSEQGFFEKIDEGGNSIQWIVPTAQKNQMEPLLVALQPHQKLEEDRPHEGEEFGYVLSGRIRLYLGEK